MLKEFKEFAVKGNVVDMGVGIVIGAAFTTIVKSFVADIVNPMAGAKAHAALVDEQLDEIFDLARDLGANVVREPREDGYAPGYYSTLFEDPDGIRIEANFVPGQGLLAPGLGQVGRKDKVWDDKPDG